MSTTRSSLKAAKNGAGGSRASFPIEWTSMTKSDAKMFLGLGLGLVAMVAFGWFIVWMIMDQENYYHDQQKKQDACLKAGGLWIDNRHTESYCFFNK